MMGHQPTSASIDANMNFEGTELDVNAIEKTFSALSWKVDVHNDLTTNEIRNISLPVYSLSVI